MDDMKKALLTLAEGLPEEAWLKEHLSELSAKETIQLTAAVMKDAPKTGMMILAVNSITATELDSVPSILMIRSRSNARK